jgi:hypothetical protein
MKQRKKESNVKKKKKGKENRHINRGILGFGQGFFTLSANPCNHVSSS